MEKNIGESEMNRMDDVMLPGFRFHPTDEELVGFYLKKKIQHRTLPIELIKQVDIYKYDPWDLPKLACSGEKEWYFYCPRDRKYRNSVRPNRVTVAGFWKATGTDRPIYSSNGNGTDCIGLKKSLVFYRGRAAKGIKTDWMMHEFRLPSSSTSVTSPKNVSDKSLPPNDSWAICRIFKKTNTMAQRALSRSWVSHIHDTISSDHILNQGAHYNLFSPDPVSCTTEIGSPNIQISNNNRINCNATATFSPLDQPAYKPIINSSLPKSYPFPFSTEYLSPTTVDVASLSFNHLAPNILDIGQVSESIEFQGQQQTIDSVHNIDPILGFTFGISSNILDTWKNDFIWDSPPCPSDISATFSNQNNS